VDSFWLIVWIATYTSNEAARNRQVPHSVRQFLKEQFADGGV
jgi:hypothetical protein